MKNTIYFLFKKYIWVFLILPLFYFFYIIFNNNPKNQSSSKNILNDSLIINMGEVPQTPWDLDQAAIQVVETFTSAVHGCLTSVYKLGSIDNSNQNVLFEKYFCEGKTCYATLKKGVRFHNNREVNAYDVEFSLIKQLLIHNKNSFTKTILNDIEGIESLNKKNIKHLSINNIQYPSQYLRGIKVIDFYNLKFILKSSSENFFHKISEGRLPIVPIEELKNDYVSWKKYPVGFGKYKVIHANLKDYEFHLEKVLKEELIPKSVKIVFSSKNIGDIKMQLANSQRKLSEYEQILTFYDVYSNGGFLYNYQTELGQNENFRKAISLALDREKIAKKSLFNEIYAEDQLLPSSGWQSTYRANIPIQKQNIPEAKKLLEKVPKVLWQNKLLLIPTYWDDVKDINSIPYIKEIKDQLTQIGLHVKFLDTDVEYDKFSKGDKNILWFTGFGISFVNFDPNKNFSHFRKGSYFTYEHPDDPEFERLFQKSVNHFIASPEETQKLSAYFTEKNIMTVIMNQRMTLSYDSRKIISLGNQYNGIRLAIWEIKLKQ